MIHPSTRTDDFDREPRERPDAAEVAHPPISAARRAELSRLFSPPVGAADFDPLRGKLLPSDHFKEIPF